MAERDKELIDRLLKENEEFSKLYNEHMEYEQKILELQRHRPQTTGLHFEIEKLKKLKLKGKDKMERILTQYR